MPIINRRFVVPTKKGGPDLLDGIDSFFRKELPKGSEVIRFACVDRTGKGLVVDATILSQGPVGPGRKAVKAKSKAKGRRKK